MSSYHLYGSESQVDKRDSSYVETAETPPTPVAGPTALKELHSVADSLLANISSVVLGKENQARLCLVALLAGEHVLLEDVPGVGKTLLGKALSRSVDGSFARIQFTPDLLPSDIIGSSIFNTQTSEFVFNQGAVFNNFILADEINRAPPRSQSALLEAMSDNQVSVDGVTHKLPDPFMVIATQNPFEFEGTYVLPESQLDRFLLRFSMGYPDRDVELDILNSHRSGQPIEQLQPVCDWHKIIELQSAVRQIAVEESISKYILDVVAATRESDQLSVGVSTRGALLWYRAAQALAFVLGRDFVIPDDAKQLAVAVLSHRVQAAGIAQGSQRDEVEMIVRELVGGIPSPN